MKPMKRETLCIMLSTCQGAAASSLHALRVRGHRLVIKTPARPRCSISSAWLAIVTATPSSARQVIVAVLQWPGGSPPPAGGTATSRAVQRRQVGGAGGQRGPASFLTPDAVMAAACPPGEAWQRGVSVSRRGSKSG